MATKKSSESKVESADSKAFAAPVTTAKALPKTAASSLKVLPAEKTKTPKTPAPTAAEKAAPGAPAKATMEKTAPKTSSTSTKGEAKAPKVTKAEVDATETSPVKTKAAVKVAATPKPEAVPAEAKVAKATKPVMAVTEVVVTPEAPVKAPKASKPVKAVAVDTAPAPVVKEPKESKKAVKPPTAKSIAADAISALAVATPSAAALAENAAKVTKPTPAPTPRVAVTPAKGSLVPVTPRLVKLLKAPALNPDDPFDRIDELSEGQFLSQQQEVLTNERRQYESSANMLQAEADQLAADMEPGDVQFDDESGEGTGVSVERERDIAMAQKANETVDEIDRALHRIGIGTYGYCIECHEMIHRDRLRAMPFAVLCMKCKTGGLSRR